MTERVDIRDLDLEDIPVNAFIMFVGHRKAGKSHTARYVYDFLRDKFGFDETYVLTRTGAGGIWNNVVSSKDKIVRKDFVEYMRILIECQEKARDDFGEARMPKICLVLDDIIGHVPANCQELIDLATTGRWLNMTVLLLTQYYHSFFPIIRINTDLLGVFQNISRNTGEEIAGECAYAGDLGPHEFKDLYSTIAVGFCCLAILRTSKATAVTDRFFALQAPPKLREYEQPRKRRPKREREQCTIL